MSSLGEWKARALLQHTFEKLSDDPAKPPTGYIFVPKGDVYITRHCRNLTSQSGRKLFIVYDRNTIERLGIHCFEQIYEAVKEDAAATQGKRQRAVAAKDSHDHEQAHKVLLECYPHIPEDSCSEVLKHGFEKGSGRVGRSKTLEDRLKVHLAVNAHIRHRLTDYDSILAANRSRDGKLAARKMVYDQVQAIADSWRPRSVKSWSVDVQTSAEPRDSAATLESNRLRRSRQNKTQTAPADEARILGEALSDLRLDGNQNATQSKPQVEAAQRIAQKVARKKSHEARSQEVTRDLLRQYELDPSIKMTKSIKKGAHRLQTKQDSKPRKRKFWQNADERPNPNPTKPTTREEYRRLVITANGVELEPRGIDRYVPDYGPSNDEPRKPRLLRSKHGALGNTPTNSGDLGDTHGGGAQLEPRGHDRNVADYDHTSSIDPLSISRCPQTRSHGRIGDIHTKNVEELGPIRDSTSEGRNLVEDSEWMDIDDTSFRTARVHLA